MLLNILSIGCEEELQSEKQQDILNIPISPLSTINLNSKVKESSGLLNWENQIWTHNDSGDPTLYAIDSLTGEITKEINLSSISLFDWEATAQDDHYIYLGDFGNNSTGIRKDLEIYRVNKQSILNSHVSVDTISFRYQDQINYVHSSGNYTDFDCEAMIVAGDSIYLFTKQWVTWGTALYSLPKTSGNHIATKIDSTNVTGLITDATYFKDDEIVILTGYTSLLSPFFILLYDYSEFNFLSGMVERISVSRQFSQMEGICQQSGFNCYVSSEQFELLGVEKSHLQLFNFTPYIDAIKKKAFNSK